MCDSLNKVVFNKKILVSSDKGYPSFDFRMDMANLIIIDKLMLTYDEGVRN